ncbi:E3 ubiquitin ligase RNF157-like [Pteropus vampyrus]|uniref:E3 ubiquitin ligase RNF157-like n=1 Tax=Pteropus vampyrus TaxID=132908 RepID=A0A6P3RYA9_PTEVA|nr:E3 ubiquitin ligase RNF157-like [Pteropus vampyrus]
MLPAYSPDGQLPPVRTLSPLDRLSDCSSQGLKLKRSLSKSISQNSSVLPEEEDEGSCSESKTHLSQGPSAQQLGQVTSWQHPPFPGRGTPGPRLPPACLPHQAHLPS